MAIKHPIPVDVLRQLLRLDAHTGRLYWRERGIEWFAEAKHPKQAHAQWNAAFAGKEALAHRDKKYFSGCILRRNYWTHRVVFALANGRWPSGDTDHIDRDGFNNRPDNLREATRSQNLHNAPSRGVSSRFRGVYWDASRSKWMARVDNKFIGRFDSEEAAARARDEVARRAHCEFAELNFPVENL